MAIIYNQWMGDDDDRDDCEHDGFTCGCPECEGDPERIDADLEAESLYEQEGE